MKRILSVFLLFVLLLGCAPLTAAAETHSRNPLLEPQKLNAAAPAQRHTNILLLGIDFGFHGYPGSAGALKKSLADCHTDAVMVVSINMTTREVDLISFPRDSLVYVPEVRGIYKLNGAFNCAATIDEGFQRVCDAASWLLGGIPIDHYCAADMAAMIALGDFIGGVDMELEMNYTGHSGREYKRGYQHLDGTGITDYLRARRNATVAGHDIGRTNRQRRTMTAIFTKVRGNAGLIKKGWNYATGGELNFFTDMSLGRVLNLLAKAQTADTVGSHVLTGSYRCALDGWNFTFTDQAHRIEVIRAVYGIEVPELPYVSYAYTNWLMETGFATVRHIALAEQVLACAYALSEWSEEQQAAVAALQETFDQTVRSFEKAADDIGSNEAAGLLYKRKALRSAAEHAAKALGCSEDPLPWDTSKSWEEDTLLNQYQFRWE